MHLTSRPRPVPSRDTHDRAFRPALDGLERRMLLYSTTGAKWIHPVRVTYSIVPDDTDIGGTPSNLADKLDHFANWELQFERAAAVWQAVAGINLVRVSDNGAPIGSPGNQQGSSSFGDIRIGGMTQSGSHLAYAYAPQPFNGGTHSGDIFFNTGQWWQTNATTYDLMTVAVHEFGHALGMGHSSINTASMYAGYVAANQTATSDDSTGFRTIYGARGSDSFDASSSNNSSTNATSITSYMNGVGQISLASPVLSSSSDVDWYKVTVPASTTGNMVVTMQSSRLSSLIPRVTVYSASLQSSATTTGRLYGDTIRITIAGVRPGEVRYIKAMAGATGSAGIGAYGLQVNFGSSSQPAIAPPNTAVASQPDQNHIAYNMGEGWLVGENFTPFLGVLNQSVDPVTGDVVSVLQVGQEVLPVEEYFSELLANLSGTTDGLFLITYGTLSGYGSFEITDPDQDPHQHGRGKGKGRHHGPGCPCCQVQVRGFKHLPPAIPAAVRRSDLDSAIHRREARRGRAAASVARPSDVDAAVPRPRRLRVAINASAMRDSSPPRAGAPPRVDLPLAGDLTKKPS